MTPERRRLHRAAMDAFAAARKAYEANPKPGSPEWEHWQALCRLAMNANDAYIKALTAATHSPTDP